jgi:hypothetical protein
LRAAGSLRQRNGRNRFFRHEGSIARMVLSASMPRVA